MAEHTGIAIDIGTSGIRAQSYDLTTEKTISTAITLRHPLPGANVIDHLHFAIDVGQNQAHNLLINAINKVISEQSDSFFELKEATLYTSFRRLEESHYITSYWGDENSGARRRYYSITENGKKYTNATIAVQRSYKNAEGVYETDFIRCTLWNAVASSTSEYCHKGDIVGIKGRIQVNSYEDKDGTKKYLFDILDGNAIETVLMEYHHGKSICVSTQVGCKMGCKFCASTGIKFERDLSSGEIVEQILLIFFIETIKIRFI